jgi:CRP-like cAMP-binding protein
MSMHPSGPGEVFWNLLPFEEQRALRELGRDREYPPGAALCVEGEPANHAFILLDGWVKILAVSVDGHELILALRGAGDIVGEVAGETTGRRNATMQAIVTVHALIVQYDRLNSFLDAHPGGSRAYRHVMAYRWRESDAMLRLHAVTTGAQRLAALLLGLADRLDGRSPGLTAESVIMIALPLSQDELASLAGTSRATVARAFGEWRKRGLIRTGQRRVTLTDTPGLRRVAGPALTVPSYS